MLFRSYRVAERAVPGAHELLAALKRAGYPMFIVSNNTRVEQEGKLARLGFDHFFDALIVSGDHPFAKPDPRLFSVALDVSGVEASEAVHVGDSYANDVVGAQASGIRSIWFDRVGQSARSITCDASQIVHDFTDYESAFRKITLAAI